MNYKLVDVSGFGHSGKSAVVDLLREFDGYHVPHGGREIDFLRIQGGLLDLRSALHDDWSPIRSDAALKRYRKVVKRMGTKANIKHPFSLFTAYGTNYDEFFNGRFIDLSEAYINGLIRFTYAKLWPYPTVDHNTWAIFKDRLLRVFNKDRLHQELVHIAEPIDFIAYTKKYLKELFACFAQGSYKTIVTLNAFEPFNPSRSLELFENAKSIVVQRDPRDIYASAIIKEGKFEIDFEKSIHWNIKKSFLGIDNLDLFIGRMKIYDQVMRRFDPNQDVLRINFEDMIFEYDHSIRRILDFLGEDKQIHDSSNKFFDPNQSAKNINLWKKLKDQAAIEKIEAALPDLCYYPK